MYEKDLPLRPDDLSNINVELTNSFNKNDVLSARALLHTLQQLQPEL